LKNAKEVATYQSTTPYADEVKSGYIDMCGFGSLAFVEGSD